MIDFLEKNPIFSHTHSLMVTYPRTVTITHGNYPFVEDVNNLMIQIKNNITQKDSYSSNVKGGKKDWEK